MHSAVDGRRHGRARHVRDPKHYEPFEKGLEINKIGSTFPAIDTVVDNIKITEGLENIARMHGPRDAGPLARAARPGQHPAFAASVSLAHGLCATANGRRSAYRGVDGQSARSAQSGDSGLHRRRPATGRGRREGRIEGVSHGRFFWGRVWPVLAPLSGPGHRGGAPATRDDARAVSSGGTDTTATWCAAARRASGPATFSKSR